MKLQKVTRPQTKIRIALQGCAGSGKTYSSLLLAYGLCNDWTKIALLDSEHQSAGLYSNLGPFNVLNLEPPFNPDKTPFKITPQTGQKIREWCEGSQPSFAPLEDPIESRIKAISNVDDLHQLYRDVSDKNKYLDAFTKRAEEIRKLTPPFNPLAIHSNGRP